jgi:Cu/Ag efflux protein CusF
MHPGTAAGGVRLARAVTSRFANDQDRAERGALRRHGARSVKLLSAVLLVNLALGVGLMLGYLTWGREAVRLERELALSRQRGFIIGRDETLTSQGVVRAVLPEISVVVVTHDEIAGYMLPMTMGFRVRDKRLLEGLEAGDVIRFTLRGIPPNLEVSEIARVGKS